MADFSEAKLRSQSQQEAQDLWDQVAEAHGASNWAQVDSYQVVLKDEFFGRIGKFASPYKGPRWTT